MASPKYPATNNAEAIELNIFNANQFFTVLQGGIDDTIPTYEGLGDIPSVAKALNEAAAYKVPLAWETTGEATDLMQPYEYDGNVYVPISVPAPFSTAPSVDHWRLYSEKNPKVTADTLHFTGDGVTTEFNVPSAVINDPAAYLVSINGVVQRPTIDYDISVSTDTLTFVEAPPAPSSGANNISVTILGNFVGALSERIYSSVSEGLAQTPAGQFFQVNSDVDDEIYVDLYKNDSGIAQKIDSYPNKFALDNAITALESAEATTSTVLDQVITRSGYTIAGDYAAGITINSYSDLILKDGLYYHLGPAISLPYVTTGVWLDEEDNFRTISLADMRQQLASTAPGEGASLISMEGGPSVEQAVNERVIRVSSRTEMKAYDVPAGTQFQLAEGFRSGDFVRRSGTPPVSDPQEGIYVVVDATRYDERIYEGAIDAGWFGADPANTAAENTTAFNAAKAAISHRGQITIPSGDFALNSASIDSSGVVIWIGQDTLINGSIDPGALPGTFITNADSGGTSGEYIQAYTSDYSPVGIGDFGRALAWIMRRGSGGSGNSEQVTLINDVGANGTSPEFIVALKGTGTTNSSGNVFGGNFTGEVGASGAADAECSALEANVTVLPATIARKAGIQIVEVAASTGQGSSVSAGILLTKQTGASGFRDAISIGSANDGATPCVTGAGNGGTGVNFQGATDIDFGINFGQVSYHEIGVQFSAGRTGHGIGWKEDGVNSGAFTRGLIRSDCTLNEGGAIKFTNGGMAIQGFNGTALESSISINNVADNSNPVSLKVDGAVRQVSSGAADSGGTGFRVLRVPN